MAPAELNYEIHDKELLAIRALETWRPELQGLRQEDRFEVLTDHRALEYFMSSKKLNARQARWAEFLASFYFVIRYRPGKENTLADVLTRRGDEATLDKKTLHTQTLLKSEYLDPEVNPKEAKLSLVAPVELSAHVVDRVIEANRTSLLLDKDRDKARQGDTNWVLDNDKLLFQGRLVVPNEDDLLARLLDEVHRQPSTAHPGRTKTKKLVRDRYYWPTWSRDVDRYIDNCLVCKRTNTWRDRAPGLLNPLPVPSRPWQHISMDFRSFPKDKHGFDAALVIVDRLTKRPISIPAIKPLAHPN